MDLDAELQKSPRIYCTHDLKGNAELTLSQDQVHYLYHVMRREAGNYLRVFNGRDGEWHAEIKAISKKKCTIYLVKQLHEQPEQPYEAHLLFPPIKRDRFDFIIEKATELGVTHLHPVQTEYTNLPKIKPERIERQIIEACEQCERLTVPQLMPLVSLQDKILGWDQDMTLYTALERSGSLELGKVVQAALAGAQTEFAFLVGPEGGFSQNEIELFEKQKYIECVSLGDNILRTETACCVVLSSLVLNF